MATRRGCSGQKQGPRSGYQNMSLFRRICQSRHGPAPSQKEWFQRVTQREICSCRRNNFSMLKIPQYRNIFKLKSTTRTHTHTHAHTRTHTHTHTHTHKRFAFLPHILTVPLARKSYAASPPPGRIKCVHSPHSGSRPGVALCTGWRRIIAPDQMHASADKCTTLIFARKRPNN